jgi:hypothetical protein
MFARVFETHLAVGDNYGDATGKVPNTYTDATDSSCERIGTAIAFS